MIKELFTNLWAKPQEFADFAPELRFYVIGDIHGCDRLLAALMEKFDPGVPIVCIGDYVDRGEESAAVLRRLMGRPDITSLMGNHEAMLLDFLDDPASNGAFWLQNGGLQTLASFGVGGVTVHSAPEDYHRAASQLRDAMGEELIGWVRALPRGAISGNVFMAHAGANPTRSFDNQIRDDRLWGAAEARSTERTDGLWVVHGHWIVPEPRMIGGRVEIDTGAYATGRLTAAEISGEGIRFHST